MADPREIFALHRYFLWSARMREMFHRAFEKAESDFQKSDAIHREPYMPYWYSGMHVVIESWRELGLHDAEIDALLESPHVELLRRYRNGAFHYQRVYWDERFTAFLAGSDDESAERIAEWTVRLHNAFRRWFVEFGESEKGGLLKWPPSSSAPG